MKKTLIASAISLASLASANAKANIEISNMLFVNGPGGFSESIIATGTLYEGGGGNLSTVDPFLGFLWSATQETMFMGNTGLWSGTTGSISAANNAFDYDDEIAAMNNDQIAVGLFFEWNNNPMAVLTIFDCTGSGTVEDPIADCTAADPVIMDNGVFIGSAIGVNAVPVPAAAWLMGSGILSLIGIARRRQSV